MYVWKMKVWVFVISRSFPFLFSFVEANSRLVITKWKMEINSITIKVSIIRRRKYLMPRRNYSISENGSIWWYNNISIEYIFFTNVDCPRINYKRLYYIVFYCISKYQSSIDTSKIYTIKRNKDVIIS